MKTSTKISVKYAAVVFAMALFLKAGLPAFSQVPDIGDITGAMNNFAGSMAGALPFNASMGLNWSDAYIGRLFPPPMSFGLGVSGGFTTMGSSDVKKLLEVFGADLPDGIDNLGGFPLPGIMLEGRLGGLFADFDLGAKIGYLPLTGAIEGLDIDYFVVGFDYRNMVVKENLILPSVSVGVGFNYLSGGISKTMPDLNIGYGGPAPLNIPGPTLGMKWETSVLDLKAQISKKILILTPYIGIGASHGWSKVSYGLTTSQPINFLPGAEDAFQDAGIDIKSNGFSFGRNVNGWSIRTFGGLSINLPFVRFDITALWNMKDNNYGITMGTRLQL